MDDGPSPLGSQHCQVPSCTVQLSSLRLYFLRQRICEEHAKADSVADGSGGLLRFCQQCSRLEPLVGFDGRRRSCRVSLAKRQERMVMQRKRVSSPQWEGAGSGHDSDGGEGSGRRVAQRTTGIGGTGSPLSRGASAEQQMWRSSTARRDAWQSAAAGTELAAPVRNEPAQQPDVAPQPAEPEGPHLLTPSQLANLLGAGIGPGDAGIKGLFSGLLPAAQAKHAAAAGGGGAAQTKTPRSCTLAGSSVALAPAVAAAAAAGAAGAAPAVAAAGRPAPAGAAGEGKMALPGDPKELHQMLNALLQLQALISKVAIPQLQQRLAAAEIVALLKQQARQEQPQPPPQQQQASQQLAQLLQQVLLKQQAQQAQQAHLQQGQQLAQLLRQVLLKQQAEQQQPQQRQQAREQQQQQRQQRQPAFNTSQQELPDVAAAADAEVQDVERQMASLDFAGVMQALQKHLQVAAPAQQQERREQPQSPDQEPGASASAQQDATLDELLRALGAG